MYFYNPHQLAMMVAMSNRTAANMKSAQEASEQESAKVLSEIKRLSDLQSQGKDVPCPYCAQLISKNALLCNHCQGILNIGSWTSIRLVIMADPRMALRDADTVKEFTHRVKELDDISAEAMARAGTGPAESRLTKAQKGELKHERNRAERDSSRQSEMAKIATKLEMTSNENQIKFENEIAQIIEAAESQKTTLSSEMLPADLMTSNDSTIHTNVNSVTIGSVLNIISGPFSGKSGVVSEIDSSHKKYILKIKFGAEEKPVTVKFDQVVA